jgi:hypothetical protein
VDRPHRHAWLGQRLGHEPLDVHVLRQLLGRPSTLLARSVAETPTGISE